MLRKLDLANRCSNSIQVILLLLLSQSCTVTLGDSTGHGSPEAIVANEVVRVALSDAAREVREGILGRRVDAVVRDERVLHLVRSAVHVLLSTGYHGLVVAGDHVQLLVCG